MPLPEAEKIWMDGDLVDWEDARIHILTHSLHYGSGLLACMRVHPTNRGRAVFRLADHVDRLYQGAKALLIEIPFPRNALVAAVKDTVRANQLDSCQVRLIVYFGYGVIGCSPIGSPVRVTIAAWPWAACSSGPEARRGVRLKISSWQHSGPNTVLAGVQSAGGYVNSSTAKAESVLAGYDEAILLSGQGVIQGCVGENPFVVKNGRVLTPPMPVGAMEAVTRDSILAIAADLGYQPVETDLLRTDFYLAEEAFLTGTAAEVVSIQSVDDREIGGPGPVTRAIQERYFAAVGGELDRYESWLDFV